MSVIAADRFVQNGAAWIDLATYEAVRLRTAAAATRREQLAWTEDCHVLQRLRHPLMCPLLDYGVLGGNTVFEAYALRAPLHASSSTTQKLRSHLNAFIQSRCLLQPRPVEPYLLRPAVSGAPGRGRALGVTLQARSLAPSVVEFLEAAGPGGPGLITLTGEPASGLRTFRLVAAREARIRGYVPVAAAALVALPWIRDVLVERHVCILVNDDAGLRERGAVGALLAALGRASTRRHVVITFSRTARGDWHTVRLGAMGVMAMTAMVFGDAEGPSASELFAAARASDGKPGVFLDRLNAYAFDAHVSRVCIAHESAGAYVVDGNPMNQSPAREDAPASGVLGRALERAGREARRGRHLAARRLLSRASRVLAARGHVRDAAACAERLGCLHLARGNTAGAIGAFERAQSLGRETPIARRAALGLALAWIEDRRFAQAEALLRSLTVSDCVAGAGSPAPVAYALARCLFWQSRYEEAIVSVREFVSGPPADVPCMAIAARALIASRELSRGLVLARDAVEHARNGTDPEAAAAAHRALATALCASGDARGAREHVDHSIAAARRGRLPLEVLKARVALLRVAAAADGNSAEVRGFARRLARLGQKLSGAPLLRMQIEEAVHWTLHSPHASPAATVTELEALLEASHKATDDGQALDVICASLVQKLRAASVAVISVAEMRLLGHSGRPWSGESAGVIRASASGRSVAPSASDGRLEAAEPVRFGGEAVAVLACRWVPGAPVDVERAVALLKAGALAAAAPSRALLDRPESPAPHPGWSDLLGESAAIVALREATARAARAPFPVLIEGESGSGKEVIARAIHRLGGRRDRRFCAVNCAALSDELLEAELFGHARGAFTGAVSERAGLFEEADGGTLLLDEIGELSARGQAKLLRVLQEGEIRRVGENIPRRVDVRIVAATNRRLEDEVRAGRFRADLRFRLDVVRIVVPPLRERATDIPPLAVHFWNETVKRVGSQATLGPDALTALACYDWPGNVRELQNVIAWMAVHSPRRGRIGAGALPAGVAAALSTVTTTFERAREEFERRFVRSALARSNGHRARAAESLGISRQGLAKMMRRLRIDDRPFHA